MMLSNVSALPLGLPSPKLPRKSPILFQAISFVVLVCVALIGVQVWLTERARVVQLNESEIAAANLAESELGQGVSFSDMNLVLAAASAGQGIAMGDELTCRQALDTGRLVRPFDLAIRSSQAYYLVSGQHRVANPAMLVFSDWLKSRLVQTAKVLRPA